MAYLDVIVYYYTEQRKKKDYYAMNVLDWNTTQTAKVSSMLSFVLSSLLKVISVSHSDY